MTRAAGSIKRGFTLIEATVLVLVLALVVPPVAMALREATDARVDAVSVVRAHTLAESVLEWVVADSLADEPGLGNAAFADPEAYLDPESGLGSRLDPVVSPLLNAGLSYTVEIGPIANESGVQTGDPQVDLFRRITVRVTAPSGAGPSLVVTLSTLIGGASI